MNPLKIIMHSGKKKAKESHGSNHTQKSKMLSIAKMRLKLNGMKTEHLMLQQTVLIDT